MSGIKILPPFYWCSMSLQAPVLMWSVAPPVLLLNVIVYVFRVLQASSLAPEYIVTEREAGEGVLGCMRPT